MRSIEVQAKTVDEAIFKGLDQMGLSIDEVDIEILEEGGKRFLGMGTKQCLIRLTERDQQEIERVLAQQAEEAERERQEKERRAAERRNNPRPPRDGHDRAEQGDRLQQRPRSRERGPRNAGGNRGNKGAARLPQRDWGEPCEGGKEAEFLYGLLQKMGLDTAKVDCFSDGQCLYMRVSGPSMGVLIGRRGETLNALQYLTSLVANRADGPYKRIVVDTENYRIKREETLTRLAKRMAEDVRRSGKPMALEPMNPYERRVLHATLQGNPYVTTHSEGEEPHRHVVITLK